MFGNKTDNLIKLKENGFNVPKFTIIPFAAVVNEDLFRDKMKHFDASAGMDSFAKILGECLRKDFDARKYVGTETGMLYAVRSSCNIEDGDNFSFAGQFETFLNVEVSGISEAVVKVVESLASDGLVGYAAEKGISLENLKMDVILQEMVDSELSGVIFSANPQGILNETVITVGEGTGDGVVGSFADTSSYYCNTTDDLYYYEGPKDYLPSETVHRLLEITDRIKPLIGPYIDIEFAIKGGEIYVLQVRRITTLTGESPLILDNSNIVESYPGLSLPLTVSFVKLVYGGVFKGVSRRVLKNDRELNKHADVFNNMVGNANGRMYYKISNWYTMLKFLPLSQKIIPVWQEMLGVSHKSYVGEEVNLSFGVRVGTYFNSLYELLRAPKGIKELDTEFRKVKAEFYEAYSRDLSPKELIKIFNDIKARLFDIWDVTLLNDMYAFIYTGLLKKHLRKKGKSEDVVNSYISGISNIESMKPVNRIIEIARTRESMSDDEYERVKREYIDEYGDRNLEELKLESNTFRTNPEIFDKWVDSILGGENVLKAARNKETAATSVKEGPMTRFLSRHAALGIANRESSRLNRCRAYGIVREIFLSLGAHYAKSGYIASQRDIFYLSVDEAFRLSEEPADMRETVEKRKEQYRLFSNLPAYSRLIFEKEEFDKSHRPVNLYVRKQDKNELSGVPCSGGFAEGEVLVVKDPSVQHEAKGKILVTKMTDPGWVFMLTSAKGVISERGSLLSHTSIISRELGIPSIVGVEGLLEIIETGDYVTMDGNTGIIKVEKKQ